MREHLARHIWEEMLGNPGNDERPEWREHLEDCGSCRARLEAAEQARYRYLEHHSPQAFARTVVALAAARPTSVITRLAARLRLPRWDVVLGLAGAAAALLLWMRTPDNSAIRLKGGPTMDVYVRRGDARRPTMLMQKMKVSLIVVLGFISACDNLADGNTRGDPLATIHGAVIAGTSPLSVGEFRLALQWIVPENIDITENFGSACDISFQWVGGPLVQELDYAPNFPVEYQFDITELPPEEAMIDSIDKGVSCREVRWALGAIVAYEDGNGNGTLDSGSNTEPSPDRILGSSSHFDDESQSVAYLDRDCGPLTAGFYVIVGEGNLMPIDTPIDIPLSPTSFIEQLTCTSFCIDLTETDLISPPTCDTVLQENSLIAGCDYSVSVEVESGLEESNETLILEVLNCSDCNCVGRSCQVVGTPDEDWQCQVPEYEVLSEVPEDKP